ncbi:hypothetical protein KUCAC02_015819 [Chaenocephalus aceratus]|uniref:Uncharacterized protein n=1 Tax=Chaenocephalus aceratus TaxID=36190 RepID=A0ACB9XZH8_CHAAC|nr:hypothetical protein KUCAC02_015819 [Chaenocephalus aceratus]
MPYVFPKMRRLLVLPPPPYLFSPLGESDMLPPPKGLYWFLHEHHHGSRLPAAQEEYEQLSPQAAHTGPEWS